MSDEEQIASTGEPTRQPEAKPSLHDTLSAAFEAEEQKAPEAAPKGAPERAPDGKFQAQPKDAAHVETQAAPIKRPSSWKKDYWEKFDSLDEDLRKYILQREDQAARGISNYRAEAERAAPIWESLAGVMPELESRGIDPAQYVKNLSEAHRILALGAPEQKLQMFARLAQDYGVPLQQLFGQQQRGAQPQQIDPFLASLAQRMGQLEQGWTTAQQQSLTEQKAAARDEVTQFAADADQYPHFEAARPVMARLLETGMADDLQSAYEKAVYLDPELRSQVVEAQHASEARARAQEKDAAAKAARARAPSVRSSSPGPQVGGQAPKGLRAQLENAFDSVVSDRA